MSSVTPSETENATLVPSPQRETEEQTPVRSRFSLPLKAPFNNRGGAWNYLILAAVIGLAAVLPALLSPSHMTIANRVLIFAIMGVGWNIMAGFGGMFSFGHAAYFGIGAYTTAYCVVRLELSPWIGLLAGVALAAAAGVGISYLALRYRLSGAYYTMSTFAFAEALRLFVHSSDALNRTVGFQIPIQPENSLASFQFAVGSPWYYWIGLALLAACMIATIAFTSSRAGRFTIAARDDDGAAAALGIDVLKHKLIAVALSASITSVAGFFYIQYYMFVDPEIGFGAHVSNDAIITAVVGGTGTIWGPLIGAVLMGPLSDVVTAILRNPPTWLEWIPAQSGLDIVLYALVLIAVVIIMPRGIFGTIAQRWEKK